MLVILCWGRWVIMAAGMNQDYRDLTPSVPQLRKT
jgi:hypothetical protein